MRSRKTSTSRHMRALAGLTIAVAACASHAADWIVSGNDGKYQRVEGRDTYPDNPPPDTLTLLDASHFPPQVKVQVDVENGIQGPPQAVAITPDARLLPMPSSALAHSTMRSPARRNASESAASPTRTQARPAPLT